MTHSSKEEHTEHTSTCHGTCWQHCASSMLHFFGPSQTCSISFLVNRMLRGKQTSRHIQNLSLGHTVPTNISGFTSPELQGPGLIRDQCGEQIGRWSNVYTTGKKRRLSPSPKKKKEKLILFYFTSSRGPSLWWGKWCYNISRPP